MKLNALGTKSLGLLFCSTMLIGPLAGQVRADDKIDNPQYKVWSTFKPESSETLETDMTMNGMKMHMKSKVTLKEVTADSIKTERATEVTVMGRNQTVPPATETIEAKTVPDAMKEVGNEDVEAMGKTFHCKKIEGDMKDLAKEKQKAGGPAALNGKVTLWVSDEVPGGIVKMQTPAPGGDIMTLTLTAMDKK